MKQGLTMFYSYRLSQNPLEPTSAMPHHRDAFRSQIIQDRHRPTKTIATFLIAKKVMEPSSERARRANAVVLLSAPR